MKVFFSFHYLNVEDFRVNVIRNSWRSKARGGQDTFIDYSLWEDAKTHSEKEIKALIDSKIRGAEATCILIGSETYNRRWVRYEIARSFLAGKNIIGIYINRIKSRHGIIDRKGKSPFDYFRIRVGNEGKYIYFEELINQRWVSFSLLPRGLNRENNTYHFRSGGFFRATEYDKVYKLNEFCNTFCWKTDGGYQNIEQWITD